MIFEQLSHTCAIIGFVFVDEINVYREISTAKVIVKNEIHFIPQQSFRRIL